MAEKTALEHMSEILALPTRQQRADYLSNKVPDNLRSLVRANVEQAFRVRRFRGCKN